MNADPTVQDRQSPEALNAIAGGWMKRGIALLDENSSASLAGSLPCFERAIEMRRSLPLRENAWYRYLLAGGWMNRGDALTRLGSAEHLEEGVRSYDQALVLLQSLELEENPLFRKRLALAWMNRGVTLQEQNTPGSLSAALQSFDAAIALLRDPHAADLAENRRLLATGLTNRGNALLRLKPAAAGLARASAEEGVGLLAQMEERETVAAETSLKSRRLLCRAIAEQLANPGTTTDREDFLAAATDAADDGLKLARLWEGRGERRFQELAHELFRFGIRAYQMHQPHFLPEFLLENLDPAYSSDAFRADSRMLQTAAEAIAATSAEIHRDIFGTVNTPAFDRALQTLRHLRMARTRLGEMVVAS